jgi:hypothetical protein
LVLLSLAAIFSGANRALTAGGAEIRADALALLATEFAVTTGTPWRVNAR